MFDYSDAHVKSFLVNYPAYTSATNKGKRLSSASHSMGGDSHTYPPPVRILKSIERGEEKSLNPRLPKAGRRVNNPSSSGRRGDPTTP